MFTAPFSLSYARMLAAAFALSAGATAAVADEDPLDVRVSTSHCLEPCTVQVTVHTQPDDNLRALVVELDSVWFFRSSLIELEGDEAPSAHWLEFPGLPAGHYEVRAILDRESESRLVDRLELTVLGHGVRVRTPQS